MCATDSDCPPASAPCMISTCTAGCCVTAAATTTTACDDGDACTAGDHCDGQGACEGTPIAAQYIPSGTSQSTEFPPGTPGGVCVMVGKYCSTTGPLSIPPPPSPAGYASGPSNPAGCDANVYLGTVPWPQYQRTFCKPCNGNCAAACP